MYTYIYILTQTPPEREHPKIKWPVYIYMWIHNLNHRSSGKYKFKLWWCNTTLLPGWQKWKRLTTPSVGEDADNENTQTLLEEYKFVYPLLKLYCSAKETEHLQKLSLCNPKYVWNIYSSIIYNHSKLEIT